MRESKPSEGDDATDFALYIPFITLQNEKDVLMLLKQLCKEALDQYETTLEEDQ